MASGTAGQPKVFEFRVPKNTNKKVFVCKFSNALSVNFESWKKNAPELAREGAQEVIKTVDKEEEEAAPAPTSGAGSQFGKEKRDEARKKKYTRRARPDEAAPWILTDNSTAKKYRGPKEGGVQDNSSYYIFTTVGGKNIEAYPVSEWYNFVPVQRYKALDAEEAEEAFGRREKTFNYFNIMYQKRLKATEEGGDDDETAADGKSGGGGGRKKGLKISTEDDDDRPGQMSDSDEEGAAAETGAVDLDGKKKGKGKGRGRKQGKIPPKGKKKQREEEQGEAEPGEESDDGDYEAREMDYDTSESSEEEMEEVAQNDAGVKGVDEEVEEMEDEEGDEEVDAAAADKETTNSPGDALADETDEDDNDEDDIDALADSVLPSGKKQDGADGRSAAVSTSKKDGGKVSSSKGTKRARDSLVAGSSKKAKATPSTLAADSAAPSTSSDGKGNIEAVVRQYLIRKPMTSKELLRKLTKKGMKVDNLGDIIKKLNPEKTKVNGNLMLHLKS
ncbi:hypothetical protein RvY_07383 [Ramazzottius varieornatus]|uniref:Transcription initiation factor IIF subunit alpha n=1 Tax=Ramazzottius varieornatus TaxID=947166 RepID=A0A1D1VBF8_RAMVA|nr:hypothetical protein RvY_07383 [Ramazzottius varieornatus]